MSATDNRNMFPVSVRNSAALPAHHHQKYGECCTSQVVGQSRHTLYGIPRVRCSATTAGNTQKETHSRGMSWQRGTLQGVKHQLVPNGTQVLSWSLQPCSAASIQFPTTTWGRASPQFVNKLLTNTTLWAHAHTAGPMTHNTWQ